MQKHVIHPISLGHDTGLAAAMHLLESIARKVPGEPVHPVVFIEELDLPARPVLTAPDPALSTLTAAMEAALAMPEQRIVFTRDARTRRQNEKARTIARKKARRSKRASWDAV